MANASSLTKAAAEPPLVEIQGLNVRFRGPHGDMVAVSDVSFSMGREKLAIVGESGSGKSITARTILGVTPANAIVTADKLSFQGLDLRGMSEARFARLRGRRMAMILQDPKQSLNPVMTAGAQIMESCRQHMGDSRRAARERAMELLNDVRIDNPQRVFGLYPHEISGGMGQRVMIAMMLAAEPDLLVADEPTSALDVSIRSQILDLLIELRQRLGLSFIFISHDIGVIRYFCDRVAVMRRGQVVEIGDAATICTAPSHPYTQALISAVPFPDPRRPRMQHRARLTETTV